MLCKNTGDVRCASHEQMIQQKKNKNNKQKTKERRKAHRRRLAGLIRYGT